MRQSPMPPRSGYMRPCGRQYASAGEAERSKAGQVPGAVIDTSCRCGHVHVKAPPASPVPGLVTPRPRATGFSCRVRLQVRVRAGNGDAEQASCESCGTWLGRYGGQVHHVIDRGMGGCSLTLINSPANAALLCGTPQDKTTCHGLATAFDAEIGAKGFWLSHAADPRLEPMMLHSPHGSGVTVWRSEDGRYLFEAPGVTA